MDFKRIGEWIKFKYKWWPKMWWMGLRLIVILISVVLLFPFLPYTPLPLIFYNTEQEFYELKEKYEKECERIGFK